MPAKHLGPCLVGSKCLINDSIIVMLIILDVLTLPLQFCICWTSSNGFPPYLSLTRVCLLITYYSFFSLGTLSNCFLSLFPRLHRLIFLRRIPFLWDLSQQVPGPGPLILFQPFPAFFCGSHCPFH